VCRKAKAVLAGAGAKASPNRAFKWHVLDPKPGELSMGRMKLRESGVEVRTIMYRKTLG
jgi:hypothetical protein